MLKTLKPWAHQVTAHEEYVVDENLKIITTPCYMMDASVGQIFRGVDKAIDKLKSMM